MTPPRNPDGAERIQLAWTRERPGTPVESIGVITRIWHAGKPLADDRRRTLARLGIHAATLDLLSTLRRHGAPYRMTPAEAERLDRPYSSAWAWLARSISAMCSSAQARTVASATSSDRPRSVSR
jgi:hypothetical protein